MFDPFISRTGLIDIIEANVPANFNLILPDFLMYSNEFNTPKTSTLLQSTLIFCNNNSKSSMFFERIAVDIATKPNPKVATPHSMWCIFSGLLVLFAPAFADFKNAVCLVGQ